MPIAGGLCRSNVSTPSLSPSMCSLVLLRVLLFVCCAHSSHVLQPINGYIANLIQHMKALPQPIPVSVPGTSPRAAVRVTGPAPSSGPQATMHPVARRDGHKALPLPLPHHLWSSSAYLFLSCSSSRCFPTMATRSLSRAPVCSRIFCIRMPVVEL